jgi:collagenase-like PrtC family protease
MSDTITYDIACNFDPRLVDIITQRDGHKRIVSLFGKMKEDPVGGGRPSFILPEVSIKEFAAYIDRCHRNDLRFNYLLNALCLGNREIIPETHRTILRWISELIDIGVDGFTVNSPLLAEVIKDRFPDTSITTGHHLRVATIQQIAYWESLGADGVTLHQSVSRNFPFLEKALRYTRKSGTTLRLIANNICLHDCPFQLNHATYFSHGSRQGGSPLTVDYNLLRCNNAKIANPVKLISSEWIRPEDVRHYHALCERAGNFNLRLKLVERTKTTEFLSIVIDAYLGESYDGNMIDYVNWHTQKNNRQFDVEAFRGSIARLGFSPEKMGRVREVYRTPVFHIDNKGLDGFLDKFVNGFDCRDRICDDTGWGAPGGDGCHYCRQWAEKCVRFDDTERREWLGKSDAFLRSMATSDLFGAQ